MTEESTYQNLMSIILQLKESIDKNNINKVKSLLEESGSLAQKTKNKLLYKAFESYTGSTEQREIISLLLSKGSDPNTPLLFDSNTTKLKEITAKPNKCDIIPLILSIQLNDLNMVKLLLDNGADSSIKSRSGKNCLFYLFITSNSIKSTLNKSKGININEEIKHNILREILEREKCEIDINEIDNQTNTTLLIQAINNRCFNIAKYLIEKGAKINYICQKDGNSVMHYAVLSNNKDIVEYLLNCKDKGNINLCLKNKENETPLDLAIKNTNDTEIYKLMAEKYSKENENENERQNEINTSNEANTCDNNTSYTTDISNCYFRIEVPVSFKETSQSETQEAESNENEGLNTIAKISQTPILYLDLSDEVAKDQLIIEQLTDENKELVNLFDKYEKNIEMSLNESKQHITELEKLKLEIRELNMKMNAYKLMCNEQENKRRSEIDNMNYKIHQEDRTRNFLQSQFENFQFCKTVQNVPEYLNRKFANEQYDKKYINDCLTHDIIDFQKYSIEEVKKREDIINNYISLLQRVIDKMGFECQIKIFGSYATHLYLPWSDVDLVLIPKTLHHDLDLTSMMHKLYNKLQEYKNFISLKICENFIYPFITFQAKDSKDLSTNINLSIQDMKHQGLQCVEYINQYLSLYKILEPLNLAIKQILKSGKLISYYVSIICIYNKFHLGRFEFIWFISNDFVLSSNTTKFKQL